MRGQALLTSIRVAVDVLEDVREHLVLIGGCVLALYARPQGAPLRATKDVDCLSTLTPWTRQQAVLARLSTEGRLAPDLSSQFRYSVPGTDVVIDVLSPDGMNIGGGDVWLRRAADNAREYVVGDLRIRAVTPAYFLVLKLAALLDRGADLLSSKDAEDIVCLAVEVEHLGEQVEQASLVADVRAFWREILRKHRAAVTDIPDIVDAHLHREDGPERERAARTLQRLA